MRKQYIIGIMLIINILLSCNNSSEPTIESPDSNYFPLAIGNKWYFKLWDQNKEEFRYPESYSRIEEIISTRNLNERLFYLVERSYLHSTGEVWRKDSIYYNISGDTLYQILNKWSFSTESLSVLAIFADTNNVKFQMKWNDDVYEVYSRFETDSSMNFVYYRPNWVDSGSERVFKKNIGIGEYISYQTVTYDKLTDYHLY